MSRHDDTRNQWADFSAKRRKAELELYGELAKADEARCPYCKIKVSSVPDGGCQVRPCPYRLKVARAKPVQVEAQHMQRLANWAYSRWWWPGFERWDAGGLMVQQGGRRQQEGAKRGWPDCGLFIPATPSGHPDGSSSLLNAAVEIKAPHHAPRRAIDEQWWLEPLPVRWTVDSDGDPARQVEVDGKWQYGRHSVSADQLCKLRVLDGCGWATFVAYGADEALAWLCEQAGPKPDVMPEGW